MRTATQWLRATTATVFLLSCGALPSGTLSGTADESTANDAGDLTASELPGDALGDTLPDAFSDIWTVTDAVDEVLGEVITTDIAAADIAPDATTTACFCGDSICSTIPCGETVETCPADCKGCGNGICEPGEGPKSCAIDCCGTCGDGKCKGYDCGESSDTCAKDCGSACGNKVCDKGESPQSCAQDCVWQACGNGVCEASDGGPTKCPEDCGNACGDGVCQGGEDFIACPIDCGYCGDGFCSVKIGESTANCMADCKGGECDPNLPSDVTKCDDGNPCTLETCPPAGVCHHPPIPGPCDDGSLCTTGDHCQFGACVLTNMLDCSDGNPCTAD